MGMLDGLDMNDPQTMGLLSAAAQMMQASGPSLMPHSLGQVMGSGFNGMMAGRKDAQDRQKEQLQLAMQQAQVAQALRQQAAIQPAYDAIGRRFSGQPVTAGASQAGGMPQGMPSAVPMGGMDGTGRTVTTPGFIPPPQPAAGNAPQPGQSSGSMFGLNDDALMGGVLAGPGELGKAIIAANSPTDLAKQLRQAGIDPNSPRGQQLMQENIAKQNYVAPVNARPGSIIRDPFNPSKVLAFNPHIPEGGMPQFDGSGNVTGIAPLAGAAGVAETMSRAGAAGKAAVKPVTGYDANGQPVFTNELDAATGGSSWTGGTLSPGNLKLLQTSADGGNKEAKAALDAYQRSRIAPSLSPGVEKSIGGNVETMNSDFADLYAANKSAPVTLAILDNIKKLAPQAIAGSQADKLAYVNGLLTMGGMQGAKDLASATDLLNKNANMLAINMRMGAGGGGSDALQALAQAANPNSHMQPEAIIKAADEVAGQIRMKQAQYQNLLPYKMKNDVAGYYDAQQQFSSKADPRTYQPTTTKAVSLSDIAATAKASGRSTAQVTADLRAKGYTIGGN